MSAEMTPEQRVLTAAASWAYARHRADALPGDPLWDQALAEHERRLLAAVDAWDPTPDPGPG